MKAKKIIGIVIGTVAAAAVIAGVTVAAVTHTSYKKGVEFAKTFEAVEKTDTITPQKDENGNWEFVTDRDFKVMQLTDIHIGGGKRSWETDKKALNAVAAMITEEKPDLVIVTGDLAYAFPGPAGTLNNKGAAKIFAELMETLGVYWTMSYGNHDTEWSAPYSREKIGEYYGSEELKYSLFTPGPEEPDGNGNQVINIKNSKGVITQSLILIDSNAYTDKFGGAYDNIHDNQIEWYSDTVKSLNAQNAETLKGLSDGDMKYPKKNFETVKSLAFFHIPLKEFETAWQEYEDNGFKDTENVKYYYGVKGENVCDGDKEDKVFETMLSLGSTQGVFCGHDHVNTYSLDYKGIRLTYGYSIDYLAYGDIDKKGDQRGCTVITVSPDGSFDCKGENYYQDKYASKYEKESVTLGE